MINTHEHPHPQLALFEEDLSVPNLYDLSEHTREEIVRELVRLLEGIQKSNAGFNRILRGQDE